MSDRGSGEVSLRLAWRPFGRRLAVASGCLAALISLFNHVPVSVASLRGGLAFASVLVVMKLGLFALEKSLAADATAGDGEEETQQ